MTPVARTAILLLTLLLVPSGCAGGKPPTVLQTRVSAVGHIIEVYRETAMIDGKETADGDPIHARDELSTDDTGRADFSVSDKLSSCRLKSSAAARVLPRPGTLLAVERGEAICMTAPGDKQPATLDAGHVKIDVRDPVFAVGVHRGGEVVVRVHRGIVQVRGARAGSARLVGPGGQLVVPMGQSPPLAVSFDAERLDQIEQQALRRMEADLPPPKFGFPDPAGSLALTRINNQRELQIAVDGVADGKSENFVQSISGFLRERWGVTGETRRLTLDEAAGALRSGDVDAVISPSRVPGARSIPFFGDDERRVWFLQVGEQDSRFQAALQDFHLAALDTGEYGRRYVQAFGRVPTYEALRPLVFPPVQPLR